MKKYEQLIEAAFCFIEAIDSEALTVTTGEIDPGVVAFDNLKKAVDELKEFRAAREPIFVLRGHDRLAPRAIVAWGQFVSSASATGLAGEHASYVHDRMLGWQEAHPNLVKMPD